MAKTIIALHDDAQSAYHSIRDLIEDGISRNDISVITPLVTQTAPRELFPLGFGDYGSPQFNESRPAPVDEIRSLLSDLESIKVPVVGQVYAAGPLAVELSIHSSTTFGSTTNGAKSGMMGALMKLGVSEERAHYYAEGVRRGGSLVMVKTPDYRARDAVEIINRHKPVDLNTRAREWRQSGWTGFKAL